MGLDAGFRFQTRGEAGICSGSKKGWNELRSRTVNHPSELFKYGEVAAQAYAEMGNDQAAVLPLINEVGSGTFDGDIYVGNGCRPHACPDAGVLILANISSRKVYMAWKLEGRPIVVRPQLATWPKIGACRVCQAGSSNGSKQSLVDPLANEDVGKVWWSMIPGEVAASANCRLGFVGSDPEFVPETT